MADPRRTAHPLGFHQHDRAGGQSGFDRERVGVAKQCSGLAGDQAIPWRLLVRRTWRIRTPQRKQSGLG